MAIVGEPLDVYLLKQVEDRQKFLAQNPRNPKFQQLNASRTAWVKLASGISVEDIPKDPFPGFKNSQLNYPKNYVLFNGTSNKSYNNRVGIGSEKSYDTWDDRFGIVPMPGIISLDVKAKNRGSLKEANIKIKCFSKKQFDVLDHLYLRLGYDMLIEYGWSHYITSESSWSKMGYTLINKEWWETEKDDDRDISYWLKRIMDLRKKYHSCYDGFFGKVTNFDWSVNTDGSYDISLKLITHGDVIEAISIPISDQNDSTKTKVNVSSYITNTLKNDKALRECYNSSFWDNNSNFNYDQTSYMSISNGIDIFSQHIKNLQFIGRGISNRILYDIGQHSRKVSNNDENVDASDIENFNKQRQYYFKNFMRLNPVSDLNPEIKTGGGLTVGATAGLATTSWNNEFYSDISMGNKVAGYTFFSSIQGNGAHNGVSYQDAYVAFTKVNNPTSFGSSDKNSLYNMSSQTFIRFQYILYYLDKYVIKENPINGRKQNPIRWKDDIPMYCVQGTNLINSYNPSTIQMQRYSWNIQTYYDTENPVFIDIWGRVSAVGSFSYLRQNALEDSHFLIPSPTPSNPDGMLEYINAKNLYISSGFILNLLNQNIKEDDDSKIDLFSFLKDICDEINNVFCNVNHLEPVIDETTNELYIIDNVNHPNREALFKAIYPGKLYTKPTTGQLLQMFGYRGIKEGKKTKLVTNFVRDFKLKTTISKELASMITIGATAKGSVVGENATAFSRFNQGLINRFAKEYTLPNSSTTPIKKTPVELLGDTNRWSFKEGYLSTLDLLGINIRTGTNTDECFFYQPQPDKARKNISTMTDVYKQLNARTYKDSSSGSPEIGFLPFTLDIDVDGISGYKIYNMLNASLTFLPSNYDTALEFILSGVDHKVSDNDWITTLKTIAVPKSADESLPRDISPGDMGTDTSPTGSIEPSDTDIDPDKPCWIQKSIQEIGVTAILGTGSMQNNDIITKYHDAAGSPAIDDVFWCSSYMNWLLDKCGYEHTDSKASRHFRGNWKDGNGRNHGIVPFYGAITTWKKDANPLHGHVSCIIAKKLDGAGNVKTIYCLGGNQSIQVRVTPYEWPNPISMGKTFVNFSSPSDYTPPATGWDTIPTVNDVYEAYETLGYDRNKVSNSMGRIKNAYRRYEKS